MVYAKSICKEEQCLLKHAGVLVPSGFAGVVFVMPLQFLIHCKKQPALKTSSDLNDMLHLLSHKR